MVARIDDNAGRQAVRVCQQLGSRAEAPDLARAVRWTLELLRRALPGHSVEVRVPPYGAVQVMPGGRHTRGTPPHTIETDPHTWLAVATGRTSWAAAVASGAIHASGNRADLSAVLPLDWDDPQRDDVGEDGMA